MASEPEDLTLKLLLDLYGQPAGREAAARLEQMLAAYQPVHPAPARPLDQRDSLLITYGDQFSSASQPGLLSLDRFARRYLDGLASGLHILPFYPYSSDDGFSVLDYRQIDPALGSWPDVERLQERFLLMYDAVINHISAGSDWFQGFLQGQDRYHDYFITLPPETDLSRVVRPRTLPLLTPFETCRGLEWVWTTFSADQVDLNYHNPAVLLDVMDVLLGYASHGARFLRLDAIAYLWKEAGTTCIHLPETHAVIQLIRAVLDRVAPQVLLISETNVPHADNISYFGSGAAEAQMVYNFALPPLVLHTFASGQANVLGQWAAGLKRPHERATFFNFLASHDGIGINPARDLLSPPEVDALLARGLAHGGLISNKTHSDGSQTAYELNINYFDALSDPSGGEPILLQVRRFLAAQSILLALVGMPGIYVHSLLGSRSWKEGPVQTGSNRAINRQKFLLEEIIAELEQPGLHSLVYQGFARLLRARASAAAFHPYGFHQVLDVDPGVFALLRSNPDGSQKALCLVNVTQQQRDFELPLLPEMPAGTWHDLLSAGRVDLQASAAIRLDGYQVAWFAPE